MILDNLAQAHDSSELDACSEAKFPEGGDGVSSSEQSSKLTAEAAASSASSVASVGSEKPTECQEPPMQAGAGEPSMASTPADDDMGPCDDGDDANGETQPPAVLKRKRSNTLDICRSESFSLL